MAQAAPTDDGENHHQIGNISLPTILNMHQLQQIKDGPVDDCYIPRKVFYLTKPQRNLNFSSLDGSL